MSADLILHVLNNTVTKEDVEYFDRPGKVDARWKELFHLVGHLPAFEIGDTEHEGCQEIMELIGRGQFHVITPDLRRTLLGIYRKEFKEAYRKRVEFAVFLTKHEGGELFYEVW